MDDSSHTPVSTSDISYSVQELAGCLDVAELVARLDEEVNRAGRQGGQLACMMVGLHDLPHVAAEHGPQVLDDLLAHAGRALTREFRRFDRVAYLGGGLFAVVLPGAGEAAAEAVARRALMRLHALKLEVDGERRPVSISIGVASWQPPETAPELFAEARRALDARGLYDGGSTDADVSAAGIRGPSPS